MHADDQAVAIAYEDPTRAFNDLARTYLSRHVANTHDDLGNPVREAIVDEAASREVGLTPRSAIDPRSNLRASDTERSGRGPTPDDEHDPPRDRIEDFHGAGRK
jgi:hypothetical protein